jgi:hypothetical protein
MAKKKAENWERQKSGFLKAVAKHRIVLEEFFYADRDEKPDHEPSEEKIKRLFNRAPSDPLEHRESLLFLLLYNLTTDVKKRYGVRGIKDSVTGRSPEHLEWFLQQAAWTLTKELIEGPKPKEV